jgi:hypothetical protein
MPNIEKRKGARSDLDAFFVCVAHDDTPKLLQLLRAHKVKFTIDVEPGPPEDQSDGANHKKAIYEAVENSIVAQFLF